MNATILIPDISGFTRFMTTTELTHSARAINMLIDTIINAVGEDYEVSEIEGDAVLLIKKGPAPARHEIEATCLRIFHEFHFRRKSLQKYTVCPCEACQGLANLTLKFVVHHGPVAEIKVGRFVKQSGPEMIVAHRLLKNKLESEEYIILTDNFLRHQDAPDHDLSWSRSSEEYESIGKVDFHFSLLSEARLSIPEPPEPQYYYHNENIDFIEIPVAVSFRDAYMVLMNIPMRPQWMPGLKRVVQDVPDVFVGSTHHCSFDDYHTVVSPLKVTFSSESISYAESWLFNDIDITIVNEYVFKKVDDNHCLFGARIINNADATIDEHMEAVLWQRLTAMCNAFRTHCELQDF